MIGLGRAIDRGLYFVGQVWEYWSPFALFVVVVAAGFGLAAAIWSTVEEYTAHDWHIFGVYMLSEVLLVAFAPDKTKKIRDLDGEVLVWTIDAISRHSYIVGLRDRMLGDAFGAALWGGGIGAGLLIGGVVVARIVHWRKARKRRREARDPGIPTLDRPLARFNSASLPGARAVRAKVDHATRVRWQHGARGRQAGIRQPPWARSRDQRPHAAAKTSYAARSTQ